MEAQLSAGIVRLKTASLNIPERDCCGEAVEGTLIPLTGEENSADRVGKQDAYGIWNAPRLRMFATQSAWGRRQAASAFSSLSTSYSTRRISGLDPSSKRYEARRSPS